MCGLFSFPWFGEVGVIVQTGGGLCFHCRSVICIIAPRRWFARKHAAGRKSTRLRTFFVTYSSARNYSKNTVLADVIPARPQRKKNIHRGGKKSQSEIIAAMEVGRYIKWTACGDGNQQLDFFNKFASHLESEYLLIGGGGVRSFPLQHLATRLDCSLTPAIMKSSSAIAQPASNYISSEIGSHVLDVIDSTAGLNFAWRRAPTLHQLTQPLPSKLSNTWG